MAESLSIARRPLALLPRRLHLDGPLLVMLTVLSAAGLVVLYSAFGGERSAVEGQVIRQAVAFVALLVMAQIPPGHLRRWSPWLFAGSLTLLLGVLVMGESGGGARRWLDLGLVRLQPAELMKLALPITLSALLARAPLPPSPRYVFAASALIIVPVAMIAIQPDLGTAVLIAASGVFVLFLAGLGWWYIATGAGVVAAATPLMWLFVMYDYQRQRVLTFLNPENDPLGAGYHIIQSKIAIGSGGLYGKGWLEGTQAHLNFLPERHTDFVFAVISEEFGFLGVAALLALYLIVVGRGLWIAGHAAEPFSQLLAGSIALTFFVYFFVNIGMVSGLLPVVGLPLPLISYGGTSMVTLLAGFGILMAIHTQRRS